MMGKEKNKSVILFLTTTVILTCYLAHMVDCYRVKKTVRREGRKEVNLAKRGIQEGKILFGSFFKKKSGLESQVVDRTGKTSSNASVEDATAYQTDFAGRNQTSLNCRCSVLFPFTDRTQANPLRLQFILKIVTVGCDDETYFTFK